MKIKVVVNPNSAHQTTQAQWPEIARKLQEALGSFEAAFTAGVGDATRLTRQALNEGCDWIISIGGDGTLNEVVNGFFEGDRALNPNAQLSLITRGTGGDFRKTLGLANDVDQAIQALQQDRIQKIDIGKLTFIDHQGQSATRYFNNIASFGMGGEVDRRVNQARYSKLLGGKTAFFWATFRTMLSYRNKTISLQVDEHAAGTFRVRNVAVANGQFFGGGMWIAPKAKLDDGLFDITILGDLSPLELVLNSSKVYQGTHLELLKVVSLRGKKVEATSQEEVLLDVDGEAPGRLPATFEIIPQAIRLKY